MAKQGLCENIVKALKGGVIDRQLELIAFLLTDAGISDPAAIIEALIEAWKTSKLRREGLAGLIQNLLDHKQAAEAKAKTGEKKELRERFDEVIRELRGPLNSESVIAELERMRDFLAKVVEAEDDLADIVRGLNESLVAKSGAPGDDDQ